MSKSRCRDKHNNWSVADTRGSMEGAVVPGGTFIEAAVKFRSVAKLHTGMV